MLRQCIERRLADACHRDEHRAWPQLLDGARRVGESGIDHRKQLCFIQREGE